MYILTVGSFSFVFIGHVACLRYNIISNSTKRKMNSKCALFYFHVANSSAIAERPSCMVGQFWPKVDMILCRQYRSTFNDCNVIGL